MFLRKIKSYLSTLFDVPLSLKLFIAGMLITNFFTIFYGFPQLLDPDESIFVNGAFSILAPPYGDPGWYGAPASSIMDLMSLFFGFYLGLQKIFCSPSKFLVLLYHNFYQFVWIGRFIDIAIYTFAIMVFYKFTRRLLEERGALFAALSFGLSPLILHYAQLVRMEMLMILALIYVLHFATDIADGKGQPAYIMSGIALGVGVISKYPAVVAFLVIIAAAFYDTRHNCHKWPTVLKNLCISGTVSLLTAFVFAPYLFLNFPNVIRDVIIEARSEHLSHSDMGFFNHFLYYIAYGLPEITTWPVYLVCVAGFFTFIVGYIKKRNKYSFGITALIIFSFGFLLFISSLSLHWTRWALPLALFVCFFSGYAFSWIIYFFQNRNIEVVRSKLTVIMIIILSVPFYQSAKNDVLKILRRDTRIEAYNWIYQNIPKGATLALETYTPQVSKHDYKIFLPSREMGLRPLDEHDLNIRPGPLVGSFGFGLAGKPLDEYLTPNIDYIITSNIRDRLEKEGDKYREDASVYKYIDHNYDLVKSFTQNTFMIGNDVHIYKRSDSL